MRWRNTASPQLSSRASRHQRNEKDCSKDRQQCPDKDDGTLDITRMSALVDQIAALRAKGIEVLVVTSGAVACGRSILRPHHQLDSVEQRQLGARGPMGLREITTYKWLIDGSGQTRI